jgi:zinc transport system substrate-binding protein
MKRYSLCLLIALLALVSCGRRTPGSSAERVITVTIPPFEWFVEQIGGDDFLVNVLLPPGADHHIWEPLPAQINALSGSEALIMNGQLGFEHAWMDRFMQVNPGMKVLDLSRNIELIMTEDADQDDGDHEGHDHAHGGPDPHYWMSTSAARIMARDIRNFLTELNPASAEKYDSNLAAVNRRITEVDSLVRAALGHDPHRTVMIFHPALAYMGRDYGFEQVSFEDEGKSPSPARMKELIDLAREKEIKIIFIQAEYDVRNAQSLSIETGAELIVINPMNSEWPEAVMEVAKAIGQK